MAKFEDLSAQKFGRLTVVKRAGQTKSRNVIWECKCTCGNTCNVPAGHLKKGETKSCGCLQSEARKTNRKTHGHKAGKTETPEYRSYRHAKARCENPKHHRYQLYGGRGIKFLFASFEDFFDEVGPRPEPKYDYSIDRINPEGNYEAGNVRWATVNEQANNKRNNVKNMEISRTENLLPARLSKSTNNR